MEYKRVESLHSQFVKCPSYWQNFVRSLQPIEDIDVPTMTINRALKRYKAKFKETKTQGCYIRFNDERLEQWFKLTWA